MACLIECGKRYCARMFASGCTRMHVHNAVIRFGEHFSGDILSLEKKGGGSQSRAYRGISLSFTEFYWFMRSIVLWLWHMCWSCWTLFPALSQTSDAVTHKSFGVSVPQLSVPSGSWRAFDSTSEVQTGGCGMNEGNELIAIMATLSGLLY